jgi:hypothetical protein
LKAQVGPWKSSRQPVSSQLGHRRHGCCIELLAICVLDALRKLLFRVVGEEGAKHLLRILVVGASHHIGERNLVLAKLIGDIEASIWGKTLKDCLLACYGLRTAACTVVESVHHLIAPCVWVLRALVVHDSGVHQEDGLPSHVGKIG